MHYQHLFFDMDKTIAPARQPMLQEMFDLLTDLPHTKVVVSGSHLQQIEHQLHRLPAYYLGINGNHANDIDNNELWHNPPLSVEQKQKIHDHIAQLVALLDHELNPEWDPIEDRGAQITFSPLGNTAPVEIKMQYDPDRKKREALLKAVPFDDAELMVKIGGSTSFDYIHKERHKGANVARLIEQMGWNKNECIYFGDGLYPGGNDESVIGVIDTVLVEDHLDTYRKLTDLLK